jgi:hypothetical protein
VCQTKERETIYRCSHPLGSLSLSAQPRSIQERIVNRSFDHQTPKIKPDASKSVDPPRSTKITIATKAKTRKEGSFVRKCFRPVSARIVRVEGEQTMAMAILGGCIIPLVSFSACFSGGIRRVESMELRGESTVFYAHMHTSRNQNTLLHPILARDVIVSPHND